MEDEFDKLLEALAKPQEEKEKNLEEILLRCTEFFEKYKYVTREGTDEERASIQHKMNKLRDKLKEESDRIEKDLGISKEEIQVLTQERKNFHPKEWEFLQEAEKKLHHEELLTGEEEKKRRASGRKSRWMKS